MKTFKLFIAEMAAARVEDNAKVYYHGTRELSAAKSISKNGLDPTHTEIKYQGKEKSKFKPQENKVYITPDISYAQIYAIGGDIAGSSSDSYLQRDIEKYGQYGYVFEIKGSDLVDITPDEDSIGEFIYLAHQSQETLDKYYKGWKHKDSKAIKFLKHLADTKLTLNQMKKVIDGEVEYQAHAGKKLMPFIPDWAKFELIDIGAHIAHSGKLMTSKCWRIDMNKLPELKRDGSNFFDLAEETKL